MAMRCSPNILSDANVADLVSAMRTWLKASNFRVSVECQWLRGNECVCSGSLSVRNGSLSVRSGSLSVRSGSVCGLIT